MALKTTRENYRDIIKGRHLCEKLIKKHKGTAKIISRPTNLNPNPPPSPVVEGYQIRSDVEEWEGLIVVDSSGRGLAD